MTDSPAAPDRARKVIPVPTLTFTSAEQSGLRLLLEQERGTLGRREDNHYVVPGGSVSRVHAEIVRQSGAVVITDLGSSAGTRINGEIIGGPRAIHHGDKIEFGAAACHYEDPVAAARLEDATAVIAAPEIETGPQLSPRQQQVLELIAAGMTNSEAGERLGITERTVKAYAQELYDKLGVHNRAGAVAEGIRSGLLPGAQG
jgi:DNA-binding CsgD family transcriptional regulator